MKAYTPSTLEQKRIADMLQRLQQRFDETRAELHRLGTVEFTRRYQTGPLKPTHLVKF